MGLILYSGGTSGGSSTPGAAGAPGVGIASAALNGAGHLILTRTDASTVDAGLLPGFKAATVTAGRLVLTTLDGASVDLGLVKGTDGLPGDPGTAGVSPELTLGTITTLAAGANASATLRGTTARPVLDLSLPRGAGGDPGTPGTAGVTPALTIGNVTRGTTPAASFRGTTANPILDLVLADGVKGDTGTTPVLTIGNVTQGSAAASLRGTPAAPILDLVLAKGDTGVTPALTIGNVTQGSPAASLRGTAAAPILDLVLAKGDTGTTPALTIGTVAVGTAAAALRGTAAAPILDLTIPRGESPWTAPMTWSSATAYTVGPPTPLVAYQGQLYLALKANTNVTPGTDATVWQLVQPTTTAWTNIPTGGTLLAGNPAQYRKVGDTVQLRGYFSAVTTAAGSGFVLGTLPVGFRPPVSVEGAGTNTANNSISRLVLGTNGELALYATAAVSNSLIAVALTTFSTSA